MKVKNKKSIIALVGVLAVALVGLTFAYFQSSATFTNMFTTGTYHVVTTEQFVAPTNWTPGEEIPKTITSTNEGTIPAAVRVKYEDAWTDSEGNPITELPNRPVFINLDNTDDWVKEGQYYYYMKPLDPDETTSSFIRSVTLNPDLAASTCETTSSNGSTEIDCESAMGGLANATYTLTITKETVQYNKYKELWPYAPEIVRPSGLSYANISKVAYFDPVSESTCDDTTYNATAANNGTSTCYRWRILSQEGRNTTMQLDHNFTSSDWVNSTDYGSSSLNADKGPITALKTLSTATSTWTRVPLLNYSYDLSVLGNNGYGALNCTTGVCRNGNEEILAENLRARMATAEEIAKGNCETGNFTVATTPACNNFDANGGYAYRDANLDGNGALDFTGEVSRTDSIHFYDYYSGAWVAYSDGGASNSWLYENLGNYSTAEQYRTYMTLTPNYAWTWGGNVGFWYIEDWGLSARYSDYYTNVGIRPVINVPTSSIVIED